MKSDRSFGLTMAAVLFVLSLLFSRKHPLICLLTSFLGGTFLAGALLKPSGLNGFHRKWMEFSEVLKRVTTPVFLTIFFFLFLTPIALFLKIIKKDLLGLNRKNNQKTYWISSEEATSFKDQF